MHLIQLGAFSAFNSDSAHDFSAPLRKQAPQIVIKAFPFPYYLIVQTDVK